MTITHTYFNSGRSAALKVLSDLLEQYKVDAHSTQKQLIHLAQSVDEFAQLEMQGRYRDVPLNLIE